MKDQKKGRMSQGASNSYLRQNDEEEARFQNKNFKHKFYQKQLLDRDEDESYVHKVKPLHRSASAQ